jgi:hypothetical protein
MSVPPYTVVDELPPDGRLTNPGGPGRYSWQGLVEELRAEQPGRWVRIDLPYAKCRSAHSMMTKRAGDGVETAWRSDRLHVRVEADR